MDTEAWGKRMRVRVAAALALALAAPGAGVVTPAEGLLETNRRVRQVPHEPAARLKLLESNDLFSRILDELKKGDCAAADRDLKELASLGQDNVHKEDVPELESQVRNCTEEGLRFAGAMAHFWSREEKEIIETKAEFESIVASGGPHAAEAGAKAKQLDERLREPVQCIPRRVAHQRWTAPVAPDSTMAAQFLDQDLDLITDANCGLDEKVMQKAAKGEWQLLVSIDSAGSMTDGRVVAGDPERGAMVLDAAKQQWHFTAPTVHSVPVKTAMAVGVRIR